MSNQTPLRIASGKVEQFQSGDVVNPSWIGSFSTGQQLYYNGSAIAGQLPPYAQCQGRLTLLTGTPVTTSDTEGTTLYFTPYQGSMIGLYTSGAWKMYEFSEVNTTITASLITTLNGTVTTGSGSVTGISSTSSLFPGAVVQSLAFPNGTQIDTVNSGTSVTMSQAALTTSTISISYYQPCFDVFLYDNSGTLTLYTLVWSNNNTRATNLTTQDGIYVLSGSPQYRYLGTVSMFFLQSSSCMLFDGLIWRGVWNYYNRVEKPLAVTDSTSSWNYTTATWRQVRGEQSGNRVSVTIGVSEDMVEATAVAIASNSAAITNVATGVGVNSTSTNSAQVVGFNAANGFGIQGVGEYSGVPGIGYNYLAWLEISTAQNTTTWYGTNGKTYWQTGLTGTCKT